MKTSSIADKLNAFRLMVTNLQAEIDGRADRKDLSEAHTALGSALGRLEEMTDASSKLRSEAQELTARRNAEMSEASRLYKRLVSFVRGIYGEDAPNLSRFGVSPRAKPVRRGSTTSGTNAARADFGTPSEV
jgi:hypothetical protein